MTRPHYGARTDANQPEIVRGLRALGFFVLDVSSLAHVGFDLLVLGMHRRWLLPMLLAVEVKMPGGKLTEREAEVKAEFGRYGERAPWVKAESVEDVLEWFGAA